MRMPGAAVIAFFFKIAKYTKRVWVVKKRWRGVKISFMGLASEEKNA